MKKILLSFAAILALSSTSTVFAAATCPSVSDIHSIGSLINTAYQAPPTGWVFSTEGYTFNQQLWQTNFTENLPGVTDPYKAVQIAEKDLATLDMLSVPVVTMSGDITVCDYTPQGATYRIYVENTVI